MIVIQESVGKEVSQMQLAATRDEGLAGSVNDIMPVYTIWESGP